MPKYVSAEEALSVIKNNDRVFLHGSASTPVFLMNELAKEAPRLKNIELIAINLTGNIEITKPEFKDSFHFNSLFVSTPIRKVVDEYNSDYIPIFLSEIPLAFKNGTLPIDVAVLHVSPPDENGFCSLGISTDIARAAADSAKILIAQVNPKMPHTFGDTLIHFSKIDKLVWREENLPEINYGSKAGEDEFAVGKHIAEMIDDRSTLQMGIGAIPDCALKLLTNHKDLGIHTEMFSDGALNLIENGAITNRYKGINEGTSIAGFCFGTKKSYDFINNNRCFQFLDIAKVNSPAIIRQNKKMVAINSAIEIDLTGQVCADSIGMHQFSGIGGQVDFIRGAALSEGGKPIIALTSRTRKGISRIVPTLKHGAGVVTTRGHIHYVVTEYGAVNLFGKNFKQRAEALISIAHPHDRERLEKAAFERLRY